MIHSLILDEVQAALQSALIDDVPPDDPARAGIVQQGPLQGDPEPDQARIAVTVFENDPDGFYGANGATTLTTGWEDEVFDVECGGSITWKRRFTVKARCLLVNTQEDLPNTRQIASTVRERIETALLNFSGRGLRSGNEYVARGVFADSLKAEMVQAGGPGSYDYHIKVRFELLTTVELTLDSGGTP